MGKSLAEKMREDAEAKKVTSLDINRLRNKMGELLGLRQEQEKVKVLLEEITDRIRRIETEEMPTMMDEVGVSRLDIDDHRLTVDTKYYPAVNNADLPQFFLWLREQGLDSIIKNEVKVEFGKGDDNKAAEFIHELADRALEFSVKQNVHPSTLRAFVKERQERGMSLPAVLNVNAVRTIIVK